MQAFAKDWETSQKLRKVLELPKGGWPSDAIDGLAEFGDRLGMAAGVRDRMLSGEGTPPVKTIGDRVKKGWWEKFKNPISQDGMIIGKNTAGAIVRTIAELAKRDIPNNPGGAKTDEEIKARIESREHGACLAANLYLEALELASKELPSKIEPKVVEKPPPPALPGK